MPKTPDRVPRWHCIIPFFFGRSATGSRKGGAPLARKRDYLSSTVRSLSGRFAGCNIRIYVCNEESLALARDVHPDVQMLTCPPRHLPLASVQAFSQYARTAPDVDDDDLFLFNEDDQIVHVDGSILDDILSVREPTVFSPHRWSRLLWRFRVKNRPVRSLLGVRGVLDNYDDQRPQRRRMQLGRSWDVQENAFEAYAACWICRIRVLEAIPLDVPPDRICLESASYVAFEAGFPVLKPSLDGGQPVEAFVVDHLSGYDYNRKILPSFLYR